MVPLVVVGGKGWLYDDFFQRLGELGMREYVAFPGYIPDEDLPGLYSAAKAATMPSVYEGFGLPVLEAMSCGTPVVASETSSLPEMGGEAARYVDPHDVAGMAATIEQVWQDDGLRSEMRRQGLAQAARFSWARAARETLRLYESLL